jgi:hypothetical protein
VKNEAQSNNRRKRDRYVGLDRRRYDDDFAERITGGIRLAAPDRSERLSTDKRRHN